MCSIILDIDKLLLTQTTRIMATYDVFISYSRKDTKIVNRICHAFDEAGIRYFIDRKGLSAGSHFPDQLANAILDSTVMLFVGSANSYQSSYTQKKISFANDEKGSSYIIPYLIDDSKQPTGIKFMFAGVQRLTIHDTPIGTALTKKIQERLGIVNQEDEVSKKKDNGSFEPETWKDKCFYPGFHPLVNAGIAFQFLAYLFAFICVIVALFHGLIWKGYTYPFNTSFLILACLLIGLVSTIQLRTRRWYWLLSLMIAEFATIFLIQKYSGYWTKTIPNYHPMVYTLYVTGKDIKSLLWVAVAHMGIIAFLLCLRRNGLTGWHHFLKTNAKVKDDKYLSWGKKL